MTRVIIAYILPFIISIATIYYLSIKGPVNDLIFRNSKDTITVEAGSRYIENFENHPGFEDEFLKESNAAQTIYLLGSSELASSTPAIPYNFITDHFSTRVVGIGHAGNQCFSIYAQLLAREEHLKNARIVIILSPGWFESKPSKGTSSSIFLEFNSESSLNRIIKNDNNNDNDYHKYLYSRIAELYNEFNAPHLELKLMNFKHRSSKSFVHAALYAPIILCDNTLLKLKEEITKQRTSHKLLVENNPDNKDKGSINWDSLYSTSKESVLKKSTNNSMGIEDSYYTEYIHGKTGHMEPVKESLNKELQDFKMLMKLLKQKQVDASFIITPLNTFYYKNLKDLAPTMKIIESEIKRNGFSYLNLLETDTNKYEKAILHDVMHMSDYGWYKVDKFIIDTYHLSR